MPLHKRLKHDSILHLPGDYSLTVGDVVNSSQGIKNREAHAKLKYLLPVLAKRYTFNDYTHLLVPAIVYCANKREAPPLWMLIPGPSSYGKTTAIEFILGLDHVMELGNITAAGLMSGAKKDSEEATGGILAKSMAEGGWSIFTFKDMTSVLSGDSKDIEKTLSALREIYDGSWARHLGTEGGRSFTYQGKCGLVGGLTYQAANKMHHRGAEMGERCLHCYVPPVTGTHASKAVGKRAIMNIFAKDLGVDVPSNEDIKDLYLDWMASYDSTASAIDMAEIDRLAEYAEIIAACRVYVPRDRNHQISGHAHAEATARCAGELSLFFSAARGLGLPTSLLWQMVKNIVSSTMPVDRVNLTRTMTRLLADKSEVSAKEIADYAAHHPEQGLFSWHATDNTKLIRDLEDLLATGVIRTVKKASATRYAWNEDRLQGQFFKKLM